MLKKKNFLIKQLIIKNLYLDTFLIFLIEKSLSYNHFIKPIQRLSFKVLESDYNNFYYYFKTYQKLICLISLSKKVPNKSYLQSRFVLNKQANRLNFANSLK